jgi:hypothetical protein
MPCQSWEQNVKQMPPGGKFQSFQITCQQRDSPTSRKAQRSWIDLLGLGGWKTNEKSTRAFETTCQAQVGRSQRRQV